MRLPTLRRGRNEEPEVTKGRLYVYCIVPADAPDDYGIIGVKDGSPVYTVKFKDIAAVVSQFTNDAFEKSDANELTHQRVMHYVFEQKLGVPVRFGTIREDESEVRTVLEDGYDEFKKQLTALSPTRGKEPPIDLGARLTTATTKEEKIAPSTRTLEPVEGKKHLYVYCIVPGDAPSGYGIIGVKNRSLVYTVKFKDIAAVVSEFPADGFEKNDANVLAHQRVVHEVFEKRMGVPVRFGTIREDEDEVRNVLEDGYDDFKKQLTELAPKPGEAATIEAATPTDIISEILSQSAASAVRIRQLADTLDAVRRENYEKGAAKLPEGAMKELLDFLAKAPPGSYQTTEASTTSNEQIKSFERRLDTLYEEISHLKDLMTSQGGGDEVRALRKEEEEIKESVLDLRTFQEGMKEAILGLRVVQEESRRSLERTVSESIKENMSKLTPVQQTAAIDETEKPPVQPIGYRFDSPTSEQPLQTYTRCSSCGAGLVITDRFCPHCGNPNYQVVST